jgi:hypothetical protein
VLASIVTGDMIQPSRDPETGLEIFPRLPEDDDDEAEANDDVALSPYARSIRTLSDAGSPTGSPASPCPSSLSRRSLTESICRLLALPYPSNTKSAVTNRHRTTTTMTTTMAPLSSFPSPPQPAPGLKLSGSHIYCKHALRDSCKCQAIMLLDQGAYCTNCWRGGCAAWPAR